MGPFITASYADRHNTRPCLDSHPIQRAANTRRPSMKDVSVDHRRLDVAMPQQLLDHSNACLCLARRQVRAAFEQVRGKGMPECVARGSLREPGLRHGVSDGFLHQGFVKMMATLFLSFAIDPSVFLGKDPLPG